MALIFAGCTKTEETEPQKCSCPVSSDGQLDEALIGTWDKVVKKDDEVKHYLVLNNGMFSHTLIEKTNGLRISEISDELLLIKMGVYKLEGNELTIYEENNGVEYEIKYTKTNDVSVSDWVNRIELSKDDIINLEERNSITKLGSDTWARLGTRLYKLDPITYTCIDTLFSYDYGWGGELSKLNNNLLLVNPDYDLITVDPSNGDIIDTIEINLTGSNISTICVHDNKIWYADNDYSQDIYKLVQIDLSGNVLKTINFNNSIRGIEFVNNEMYLVASHEVFGKFDINTEKFVKSYGPYYSDEGYGMYLDEISLIDDKLILENGKRSNIIDISKL